MQKRDIKVGEDYAAALGYDPENMRNQRVRVLAMGYTRYGPVSEFPSERLDHSLVLKRVQYARNDVQQPVSFEEAAKLVSEQLYLDRRNLQRQRNLQKITSQQFEVEIAKYPVPYGWDIVPLSNRIIRVPWSVYVPWRTEMLETEHRLEEERQQQRERSKADALVITELLAKHDIKEPYPVVESTRTVKLSFDNFMKLVQGIPSTMGKS